MSTYGRQDVTDLLTKLQANPEAIEWRERRELARSLSDLLRDGKQTDDDLHLVAVLADDPKWEVRREISELLTLLPDDDFTHAAAKLSEDTNNFVRKAAERALDRRRKGQRAAKHRRHGIQEVAAEFDEMERLHGTLAAKMARRISERLYDVSVGACVHNLRGVLTPIKTSTTKLLSELDGGLDAERASKHLTRIDEKVAFLERLLDDMRTYSQPIPHERRREKLNDLVRDAMSIAVENLRDKGYETSVLKLPVDVPHDITLEAARHQIVVAVTNVAKNAIESLVVDEGRLRAGTVSICAKLVGDRIELAVEDDGDGMSAEDLEEIREFVPGQTTKKQEGTGFGLPTAKKYIEAHGGEMGIDSRDGEGTCVTIILPTEQTECES
ncbi:MAG: hypothetical protein CMJ64_00485 [Planctomycetaceae bacterium]|nr:hypothetical protein [Planctomycetaceae bacterium]